MILVYLKYCIRHTLSKKVIFVIKNYLTFKFNWTNNHGCVLPTFSTSRANQQMPHVTPDMCLF